MAKFSWEAFLNKYRVPYNDKGPNTPRGALTVQCPFCGHADPSDHMVLWGSGWRCWRNFNHRGKHPAKLVQALIRCSNAEAERITASATIATSSDLSKVAAMLSPQAATVVRDLSLPPEFRPLKKEWACEPYLAYLRRRGIKENASYLHWRYALHYCTHGPFRGRIIFPVVHAGKIISWTGRTIYPSEDLRYKSLTTDPEAATKAGLEAALAPVNHHFLWYDWLTSKEVTQHAQSFVLVEGPLDALNVNVLAEPMHVATCWTGSEPTVQQIELLHTLARPFKRRYVISDSDMPQKADRIANKLAALQFEPLRLPVGVDDPAEIQSFKQLRSILAC